MKDHWVSNPNPFPVGGTLPLYHTLDRPKPEGCYFDAQAADDAVNFVALMCHTQGPLAGKPFILAPEQVWVTREAFGWKRSDDSRLIRTVYVEEGRANGKSQWGAAIAGKLLYADGESNPEIVGAAKDRQQARIILQRLQAMIRTNPDLLKRSSLLRSEIRHRTNGGTYRATSADVGGAWGGAPHGIIFDEVHAQPNRDLWDALTTGTGKRRQPMIWAFTTAGWDRETLCWELHELVRQIFEATIDDPSFLGVVWAAAEDADWTDPNVWQSANPLLARPDSDLTPSGSPAAISHEYMAGECRKALSLPAFQNTFRTMYLSQWVGQEVRFIPMEEWDQNAGPVTPSKRPAFGGLDLASNTDLASFQIVSRAPDGMLEIETRLYAPADNLRERCRRDRVPYDVWARDGFLTLTPGNTIDQDYIKADVLEAMDTYDLKDVGYDKWNANKLVKELENEGVTMVEVRQGFASLSVPTKELLRLTMKHSLRHGGHPLLRWMVSNTAATVDAAENIKPDKAKSTGRIDGVVATILALDGYMRRGQDPERKQSRYNSDDSGLLLA